MKTHIRKSLSVWLALPVLAVSIAGAGCRLGGPSRPVLEMSGATMGTVYQIKVLPPDTGEIDARALRSLIEAELDAVDTRMSTYDSDSELSRFNAYTSTEPFQVSEMILEVFRMAQDISEQSQGAFDVTIGPLVNAWGFGPADWPETLPSDADIQALMAHTGYRKLRVDLGNATLQKDDPAVYCDLSGIAKGYAVDRVCIALEEAGFPNYMVEIGGEVRTGGRNAQGLPWRIGVVNPDPIRGVVERIIPLSGWALATSGDYRNVYERDGVRYSHTIDPRTGRPVAHNLTSASVIHREAAVADAYATALMVMGPQDGLLWAQEHGIAALLITREPDGSLSSAATEAFDDFIANSGTSDALERR